MADIPEYDRWTLHRLVNNPSGKYTRQVGARYMIRDAIAAKFRESMMNIHVRKRYKSSITRIQGKSNSYIIWIRVPSEKYSLDYDVVMQLTFPEGTRAVSQADIRLYCNSPGWTMTVGYVAATQGLLIPGWEKLLGRAAKEAPSVTNPNEEYGYDKTTYRAFLYLIDVIGIKTIGDLGLAIGGNPPNLKDTTLSAEYKLLQYERAKSAYAEAERVRKAAEKAKVEIERQKEIAKKKNMQKSSKAVKAVSAVRKARQSANAKSKKR